MRILYCRLTAFSAPFPVYLRKTGFFSGRLMEKLKWNRITYWMIAVVLVAFAGRWSPVFGQFGLGSIPYVGGYISQAQGYVNMAQSIASGNLGAIPYAGGYISMAQNIAQGNFGGIPYAGSFINMALDASNASYYDNDAIGNSPEMRTFGEMLNQNESEAFFCAQLCLSPKVSQINQIAGSETSYLQLFYDQTGMQLVEYVESLEAPGGKFPEKLAVIQDLISNPVNDNSIAFARICYIVLRPIQKQNPKIASVIQKKAESIAKSYFRPNPAYYTIWLDYFGTELFCQGNCEEAERLYRQSFEIKSQRKDEAGKMRSLGYLMRLYMSEYRFSEATFILKQIIEYTQAALEPAAPVRGARPRQSGESSVMLKAHLAESLTCMGIVHFFMGEFYDAEKNQKNAELLFQNLYKITQNNLERFLGTDYIKLYQCGCYARMAQIYMQKGEYDAAFSSLDKAEMVKREHLKYIKKTGPHGEQEKRLRPTGEIECELAFERNVRAALYRKQNRLGLAEQVLTETIQTLQANNRADRSIFVETLQLRGQIRVELGPSYAMRAANDFKTAIKTLFDKGITKGPRICQIATDFANVCRKQKDYENAEKYYKLAESIIASPAVSPQTIIQYYYGHANYLYETGDGEAAVEELQKAIDHSQNYRKNVSIDDQDRAIMFAEYYYLYTKMVQWQKEFNDVEKVYQALEMSRAQGIQDLMKTSSSGLLAGLDKKTADLLENDYRTKRTRLNMAKSKYNSLCNVEAADSQTQAEREKLKEVIKQCQKDVNEAWNNIKEASPAFKLALAENRQPAPFSEIQKRCDEDQVVVLEYMIGEKECYLLAYGHGLSASEVYTLEISSKVAEYLKSQNPEFQINKGPLTAETLGRLLFSDEKMALLKRIAIPGSSDKSFSDAARILYALWHILIPTETLRTKVMNESNGLLILPDGILSQLPFETLVVEKSEDASSVKYLLDGESTVFYAPSATLWYHLKEKRTQERKETLTAGNPAYSTPDKGDSDVMRAVAQNFGFDRLTPLPETANETQWIADYCREYELPVVRLDGSETTEANIRKNITDKRIVHFACHGMLDNKFGNLFGALALTPGNDDDPENDGFLTLGEMYELNLSQCELAILSACDTNRGVQQKGEGTWSLGRGMLVSGARRVVTSDWSVDDASTATLMALFVANTFKAGALDDADIALALRHAKRSLRENRERPEWSHPYYWAPFVLIGPK